MKQTKNIIQFFFPQEEEERVLSRIHHVLFNIGTFDAHARSRLFFSHHICGISIQFHACGAKIFFPIYCMCIKSRWSRNTHTIHFSMMRIYICEFLYIIFYDAIYLRLIVSFLCGFLYTRIILFYFFIKNCFCPLFYWKLWLRITYWKFNFFIFLRKKKNLLYI